MFFPQWQLEQVSPYKVKSLQRVSIKLQIVAFVLGHLKFYFAYMYFH
jgi:hypothetical protein